MTTFSQDESAAAELHLFCDRTLHIEALTENEGFSTQYLRCVNWNFLQDRDMCLEKHATRLGAEHKQGSSA